MIDFLNAPATDLSVVVIILVFIVGVALVAGTGIVLLKWSYGDFEKSDVEKFQKNSEKSK